jgi:5'-3' exonuclease
VRVLYIDGNHLASRARYTQEHLRTSDGKRSGVIYGVLRGVSWIQRQMMLDSRHVIAVWDGGRCQAREQIYPLYKQRKQSAYDEEKAQEAADYVSQLPRAREALSYLGIRNIRVPGMEADDAIALLVKNANHSHDATIYSADRDFHQLAHIADIWDPKKDLLGIDDILKLHKVQCTRDILLIRALTGDKSDNINGVGYVGAKYAAKALELVKFWLKEGRETEPPEQVVSMVSDKLRGRVERGWDTFKRNLRLMSLPPEESFYSPHQYQELGEQTVCPVDDDPIAYTRFLKEWELLSLMNT